MCENCKNKSICKYIGEYERISEIARTPIEYGCPISINVMCSMFRDKELKIGGTNVFRNLGRNDLEVKY